MLNGTITPWLLGGLGLIVLFALVRTISSWRSLKKSPYFYMRQQAAQHLRMNLLLVLALIGGMAAVGFIAQRQPVTLPANVALIASAKPVAEESTLVVEPEGISIVSYDTPKAVEISVLSPPAGDSSTTTEAAAGDRPDLAAPAAITPLLPTEFDQYEPVVDLQPNTRLGSLLFSTDIDDNFEPVAPQRVFGEGFFTVYATFFYEAMADGMEWAWIWRYNGQIVNGGNELWAYGDEGPGWIYYQPPEGFREGEYTLEVWVNGKLFGQSSISVESGVANQ